MHSFCCYCCIDSIFQNNCLLLIVIISADKLPVSNEKNIHNSVLYGWQLWPQSENQ